MTAENRKTLLAELINTAQESKNFLPKGTPGRTAVNRILRLAKLLYVDAIKTEAAEIPTT